MHPAAEPEREQISIHAPRVGSDNETVNFWQNIDISIHAPRVGSDSMSLLMVLI